MARKYELVKVITKEVDIGGKKVIKYFIPANKIVDEITKKFGKEPLGFKYIILNDGTVVLEPIM